MSDGVAVSGGVAVSTPGPTSAALSAATSAPPGSSAAAASMPASLVVVGVSLLQPATASRKTSVQRIEMSMRGFYPTWARRPPMQHGPLEGTAGLLLSPSTSRIGSKSEGQDRTPQTCPHELLTCATNASTVEADV